MRMDIGKDILYLHSGYLNPWPSSAWYVRNYELREWTFIADLAVFLNKESNIIYILKNISLF